MSKKTLVLIIISILSFATMAEAKGGRPACDLHDSPKDVSLLHGLSPYWAQEQIGADLAKAFMEKNRGKYAYKNVSVVDVDSGFDKSQVTAKFVGRAAAKPQVSGNYPDHGSQVLNVLAGNGRYGVGKTPYVQVSDIIESHFSNEPATASAGQSQASDKFEDFREEVLASVREVKDQIDALSLKYYNNPSSWTSEDQQRWTSISDEVDAKALELFKKRDPANYKKYNDDRIVQLAQSYIKPATPMTQDQLKEFHDSAAGSFDHFIPQLKKEKSDLVSLEIHTLTALMGSKNRELNKAFDDVSKHSIIMACAGNYYSIDGTIGKKLVTNGSVIVVGSSHPTGLTSQFSNSSPDVTILAPSDEFLFSPNEAQGDRFGGTSGAQPLVTGSLANAMTMIKPLSTAQAKQILQATAIPVESSSGQPGLVNSYKLVRYAARLKSAGWPAQSAKLLKDSSLLDFTSEAAKLFSEAEKLAASKDCAAKSQAITKLRASFLLNPTKATAQKLAELYFQSQYPMDAIFYRTYGASASLRTSIANSWRQQAKAPESPLFNNELVDRNGDFFSDANQ